MFENSFPFFTIIPILYGVVVIVVLVLVIRLALAATRALNAYSAWRKLATDLLIADNQAPVIPPATPPVVPPTTPPTE